MTRPVRRGLVIMAALGACLLLGYTGWKRGTPYGDPTYSSNGKYYIQKFSNVTATRFLPAMPGQGSDGVDGYIRCYDREGTLLHERFVPFLRDVQPIWANDVVYLGGVSTHLDTHPWRLPTPAE